MHQRKVTDPDGRRWVVERRWLIEPPRYLGFRFGRDEEPFEKARPATKKDHYIRNRPTTKSRTRGPIVYKNQGSQRRNRGTTAIWVGGGRSRSSSSGSSGSSSGGVGSSGGGSRSSGSGGSRFSSAGGSRSKGSSGGKRGGGGGGAAAGAGGLLAALGKAIKVILIVAAVVAAALFMIFVGWPAIAFAAEYLVFALLVLGVIVFRVVSGRGWIVDAEEEDGYRVVAWRIDGWKKSGAAVDQIADAIRAGQEPNIEGAERVIVDDFSI